MRNQLFEIKQVLPRHLVVNRITTDFRPRGRWRRKLIRWWRGY